MGEVAELVLEGIICEVCGIFVGEPAGYPRTCDCCCIDKSGRAIVTVRRQFATEETMDMERMVEALKVVRDYTLGKRS